MANSKNSVSLFGKKGPSQLIYSPREKEVMKEIFCSMVNKHVIDKFEFQNIEKSNEKLDKVAFTLIKFGIATGEAMTMLRDVLSTEFSKIGQGQEGSILRGNSLATKLSKVYINYVGRDYMINLLKNFTTQLCIEERKRSLEIDPRHCEEEEERKNNAQELIKKATQVMDIIMTPDNIDKMPPEMRVVSSYFVDLAAECAPNQKYPLVGGFLFLRFLNPALLSPEQYGLVPEGKNIGNIPRRNLLLLTKILQNLSNGVEFGKKEVYMQVTNPFLQQYLPKIQNYFEKVASYLQKASFKCIPDDRALTIDDFHHFHQWTTDHEKELLPLFDDQQDALNFQQSLKRLGSYQSKTSFSFLSEVDRRTVSVTLGQFRDEASYIGIVTKHKRAKKQPRILIIGHNRILSIRPGGKLARQAHLLDLLEISSSSKTDCELIFRIGNAESKTFSIAFNSDSVDDIILLIRDNYEVHFSSLPQHQKPKFNLLPTDRIKQLNSTPTQTASDTKCGGFVGIYLSVCNYYDIAPNQFVSWHFTHLPPSETEFNLKRFTSNSETPLTSNDFGTLFWSLRFNTYFTSFTVKNYKMDKESLLDLAEVMKNNTTLTTLRLRNVGGTSSAFSAIFDNIHQNRNCHLTSLDLSGNLAVDDKAISHFGIYLSSATHAIECLKLNGTGITATGIKQISSSLKERAKTRASNPITYLNLSDTRFGSASGSFVEMLSTATVLKSLYLANTGLQVDLVAENLRRYCPQLETLDISRTRPLKSSDLKIMSNYLSQTSSLTRLNLSGSKFPQDQIKPMFTTISNQTKMSILLKNTELGPTGGKLFAEITFNLQNISTLDLTDNEFGDEVLAVLCEALCSNTSITNLILDGNFRFKTEKSRKSAIQGIVSLITSNDVIKHLAIAGRLESAERQLKHDIVPILYALGSNKFITHLDISAHSMGNKGAIALSKALQTNDTLTTIQLADNAIGLLGFVNLSKVLESNSTLKVMPIPMGDVVNAMKRDDPKDLTKVLNDIESSLIKNQ